MMIRMNPRKDVWVNSTHIVSVTYKGTERYAWVEVRCGDYSHPDVFIFDEYDNKDGLVPIDAARKSCESLIRSLNSPTNTPLYMGF